MKYLLYRKVHFGQAAGLHCSARFIYTWWSVLMRFHKAEFGIENCCHISSKPISWKIFTNLELGRSTGYNLQSIQKCWSTTTIRLYTKLHRNTMFIFTGLYTFYISDEEDGVTVTSLALLSHGYHLMWSISLVEFSNVLLVHSHSNKTIKVSICTNLCAQATNGNLLFGYHVRLVNAWWLGAASGTISQVMDCTIFRGTTE